MRLDIETVSRYIWIVLVAVIAIVVMVVVVAPAAEVRSTCSGFQYFVFLSQKSTNDSYTLELLNGPRDIEISSFEVNGISSAVSVNVSAGDTFVVSSRGLGGTGNFRYPVTIFYDMSSIKNNKDTGSCTGKIQ